MNVIIDFSAGLAVYMARHWLADFITRCILAPLLRPVFKLFKKVLIKSEEDLATWAHFKLKAQKQQHQTEHLVCIDGACATIKM